MGSDASTAPLLVPNTVGIRHLSPAGALHVRRTLDRVQPSVVLLEAPAGVEAEVRPLLSSETTPPVALLAFTSTRPVKSFIYPFASYSPEWVACRWALENRRELLFIDLPADTFLALQLAQELAAEQAPEDAAPAPRLDLLEALARSEGTDKETWWERTFEHTVDSRAYIEAVRAYAAGLRETRTELRTPALEHENQLREAFMRRRIREALARHPADRAVAICGAYHVSALTEADPPMTDEEVRKLPRAPSVVTLMPYSYERLHERSGYGAGNHAPSYFGLLHRHLEAGRPEQVVPEFLSRVARALRKDGGVVSAAQVIEACRLAEALASLRGHCAVTLTELRDAAITCLGEGSALVVGAALDEAETGAVVGTLPSGVSRTALQQDFRQEISRLHLEKYLTEKAETLDLDLREDRYAKREETAFLDRHRSIFFHRLGAIGIRFADQETVKGQLTSWKERWKLRWTAEMEVRIAELSLLGDSVPMVVAHELGQALADARDCGSAAQVLLDAATCSVADALESARARLQAIATEDESLPSIARAADRLVTAIRYGGVRAVDPEPLWPLAEQLFRRAALLLPAAVGCDDQGRAEMQEAMVTVSRLAIEERERLPVSEWQDALSRVATRDSGNPFLCGVATAVLLERQALPEEALAGSLGRRLSPGELPELAAGFFEGLASYNRTALLSRPAVWRLMTSFVDRLDTAQFLQTLVPLRRAFSGFAPAEIRRVVAALSEVWGAKAGQAELTAAVEKKIDPTELEALQKSLEGLDDLDL